MPNIKFNEQAFRDEQTTPDPSAVEKFWAAVNKPLYQRSPERQKEVEAFTAAHPTIGPALDVTGRTLDSLSSPLSLLLAGLSGGESLASRLGLTKAASVLSIPAKAASAAMIPHGAYKVYQGYQEGSKPEMAGGVLESLLGGLGVRGALRGGPETPPSIPPGSPPTPLIPAGPSTPLISTEGGLRVVRAPLPEEIATLKAAGKPVPTEIPGAPRTSLQIAKSPTLTPEQQATAASNIAGRVAKVVPKTSPAAAQLNALDEAIQAAKAEAAQNINLRKIKDIVTEGGLEEQPPVVTTSIKAPGATATQKYTLPKPQTEDILPPAADVFSPAETATIDATRGPAPQPSPAAPVSAIDDLLAKVGAPKPVSGLAVGAPSTEPIPPPQIHEGPVPTISDVREAAGIPDQPTAAEGGSTGTLPTDQVPSPAAAAPIRMFKSPVDVLGSATQEVKGQEGVNPLAVRQLNVALQQEAQRAGLASTANPDTLTKFLSSRVGPAIAGDLGMEAPAAAPKTQVSGLDQTAAARAAALARRQSMKAAVQAAGPFPAEAPPSADITTAQQGAAPVASEPPAIDQTTTDQLEAAANAKTISNLQAGLESIPPEVKAGGRQAILDWAKGQASKLATGESGGINPSLALHLGMATAGGLGGAHIFPEHPYLGGLAGALSGLAISTGITGGPELDRFMNINVPPEKIMSGLRAATDVQVPLLLSPQSSVIKSLSDLGTVPIAAWENPAQAGAIMKGLLDRKQLASDFMEGWHSHNMPSYLEEPSPMRSWIDKTPLSYIPRSLGGITEAFKGIYRNAGLPEAAQQRYTLTNKPIYPVTKGIYNIMQHPAVRFISPIAKVPLNIAERTFEYGTPYNWITETDPALKALARRRFGLGLTAGAASLAYTPPNFVKEHPFLSRAIAASTGPLVGITGAAMAGKQMLRGEPTFSWPSAAKNIVGEVPGYRAVEDFTGDPYTTAGNFLSRFTNVGRPLAEILDPNASPVLSRGANLSKMERVFNRPLANIPLVRNKLPHKQGSLDPSDPLNFISNSPENTPQSIDPLDFLVNKP